MTKNNSLEQKILQAAEELFIQKGFAGTSTTDIAKKVGCNQALVHYYFRTKDHLFEQIFEKKFELMLSYVDKLLVEGNFLDSLQSFLNFYFNLINNNRQLPFYIMSELVMNEKRREFIREKLVENEHRRELYQHLDERVQNEVKAGNIRPIKTFDLLINIISLTASNFVFLPVYTACMHKTTDEQNAFIEHRKQIVIELILRDLRP